MRRKGEAEGLIRYGSSFWRLSKNQANQFTVNREPARGTHPLDVTAPMTTQMHWDLEKRSGWPNNLKLWQRPTPWINPTYNVGVMRYKGRIVHDFAGNPIRDFRIPLTISSAVEGLRIESWMRSDDRLTLGDIEARMWTKDGGPHGREPCYGKRLLSKRASLARVRAGLISWMAKKGRDAQTAYMDSLRTPANRAANQVRDEDLNAQQRAAYANMGLDESKKSSAPTRAVRIKKIKKAAGGDGAAAASSSGAANPDPADPVAAASSEESEDGDESQADPEAQDQEQASEHSWSSSIEDPLDSRNDFPTNPEEEALLQRALQITREEFVTLVGQEPAPTNPGDNYNSQWGTLQAQYRVLWAAADHPGHPVVEFGPPRLVARGRWTGGISRFEDAEEIEGEW